jgi:hypothetical protein
MAAFGSRPGLAAGTAGLIVIADELAARLSLRADESAVYIWGRPTGWACGFRSRFGLPCPTCGLTRSIVLSLHGELGRAWAVAPAGPVVVCGLVALALAMFSLAIAQAARSGKAEARARSAIRYGTLVYAAAAVIVWIGGWAASFTAALRRL